MQYTQALKAKRRKEGAGHRTQMREDFPDLWCVLQKRYVEHVWEIRCARREAIAGGSIGPSWNLRSIQLGHPELVFDPSSGIRNPEF